MRPSSAEKHVGIKKMFFKQINILYFLEQFEVSRKTKVQRILLHTPQTALPTISPITNIFH